MIVERAITLEREPSKKKQRTDTKKNAKRIKSDRNFKQNQFINECARKKKAKIPESQSHRIPESRSHGVF